MAAIARIAADDNNKGALDFQVIPAATWASLGAATWQEVEVPRWAHKLVLRIVLPSNVDDTSGGFTAYVATNTANGDGGAVDSSDGVWLVTNGVNTVQEFNLSRAGAGTTNIESIFIAVDDVTAAVHLWWESAESR